MHFKDALSREGVNIIAEFKRASPSLGDIDVAADPVAKVKIYALMREQLRDALAVDRG